MTVPVYSQLQEIGLPWVGPIPARWDIAPLFSVAREREESNAGMVEDNLLSLSYGRIVRKDMSSNDGLLPESFETYQVVYPGDVVFRLTDLQNDKRSLRTALVGERGIITSAYLAVCPEKVSPSYLNYLLRAYDLSKAFYSMGGGLRQSMKFSDLKRLPVLLPSPAEQAAIVSFLDRETGKIDALVDEQKRLIDLLKEKRQAVISHAVTKGLNPDAPMKPSGVEWLGEVPEHWTAIAFRHLLERIEQGWSPECENREASFEEWGVLKAGCANGGAFRESENKALPEDLSPLPELEVRPGDVVMSRANGSAENVGAAAFVRSVRPRLMLSDKIFRLHPSRRIAAEYLALMLGSLPLRYQVERSISGAEGLANNLPQSALRAFWTVVPPLVEQDQIVAYAEAAVARMNTLIADAELARGLLMERRASLISAAVTGKIDVRQQADVETAA